jgi:hypothetical protein
MKRLTIAKRQRGEAAPFFFELRYWALVIGIENLCAIAPASGSTKLPALPAIGYAEKIRRPETGTLQYSDHFPISLKFEAPAPAGL